MKDMGEASYILGVKIHRNRSKRLLTLSQEQYIQIVIERFRMKNYNPINTPMEKGEKLSNNLCLKTSEQNERMEKVSYASAMESLMYVMLCTRTDISYVVGMVNRYQYNPGEAH